MVHEVSMDTRAGVRGQGQGSGFSAEKPRSLQYGFSLTGQFFVQIIVCTV